MAVDKWGIGVAYVLLAAFAIYLFFYYFSIFFQRRKKGIRVLVGIIVFISWQVVAPSVIHSLPVIWKAGMALGFTLFAVINIFEGKVWMKVFFFTTFDVIWMLSETLIGNLLLIYGANIQEQQLLGSFTSKLFFFLVIVALKKVFTNEKIMELPPVHSILIVLIPVGSIYIMNAVFILAYRAEWRYREAYSFGSVVILLFINVLIFYIYIKLAEDLQIRRMNLVYEQQLELYERYQKERELSILQIRDVRHSMRNHFLSILAYAEKGECGKIIQFVNDVMEEGKLMLSEAVNTGNIVTDSQVGYWQSVAENEGIKFQSELSIPMEMPFRGADISLILGNLLENAVEAAQKVEGEKYIRLKLKYDKRNLLVIVENNYKGELVREKENKLRTTKADAANHGIGISSVRRVAEKYQGTVNIDDTVSGRFVIRVVLYGARYGKFEGS